jgi:spermidine synthase
VLYSTGFFTMGAEILVIFAFQIFFGYIYLQIGLIVTVFLAGLFPGALCGQSIRKHGIRLLTVTEFLLIFLMGVFIFGIAFFPGRLSGNIFLVFGFCVALVCGCQFPVALDLGGANIPAAVKMFSADLIGAAYGTLVTSILFIPFGGILWAAAGLIFLKLISAFILNRTR